MPKSGEQKQYARPPITEAVFEFRTDNALSNRDLERCRDRFKRQYEKVEDVTDVELLINEDGKIGHKTTASGYKLTASNAVDLVLLNPLSLATIRLAPYSRWENLLQTAQANFDTFVKIVGRRNIVRLGSRFVNRIDIPNEKLAGRRSNDFLQSGIEVSEAAGEVSAYLWSVHATRPDGIEVKVQTGTANPVLIDHTSFLIDIDASMDSGIPPRIDDMWERAELLRVAKNSVFESMITDRCRELFQ
jgi:uncharacterized protein (TIGR04255 family)